MLNALAVLALALVAVPAHATLLQILHTNDLHSHFEHAQDPSKGNYAALKFQIDRLKAEAAAQGIETLVLDAGDFTEGTSMYLADRGEWSWKMMDAIGYDAVVLGNHDYLMGQEDLDRILGAVRPGFHPLAANYNQDPGNPAMRRYLKPFAEFNKSGLKIAVLGLTCDEFEYKWRAGPLAIDPPQDGADRYAAELKSRNDLVIALTHIGVDADKSVARKSLVDLVVGGHWHSYLTTCKDEHGRDVSPCSQTNPDGRKVPIVQAGQHGEAVGRLLIDVEPGKDVAVLKYEFVPIASDGPHDAYVDNALHEAREALEHRYGRKWLREVVGYSEVPLLRPNPGVHSVWGNLMEEALREAVGAQLAIDSADLYGDEFPAGPVTREDLFNYYPRVFNFDEPLGWTVWTADAQGWVIRFIIQTAMKYGVKFNVAGATYDVAGKPGKPKIVNFRIGGKKVRALKTYHVALPEGIGRGIKEIIELLQLFLRHPTNTRIPVWTALEAQLKRIGGVVKDPAKAAGLR